MAGPFRAGWDRAVYGQREIADMRVLFITSNRIGDAVLSTGILNHIIRENQDLQLTVACGPEAAPLFSETLNLEKLIPLEKAPRLGHWRKLWSEVKLTRWDLVVDLRASILAYFLWSRKRCVYRPSDDQTHRVVQLSRFFGLEEPAPPGLWFGEKQVVSAKSLIPQGEIVLAVGPTANWGGKQWPAGKFADVVLRLTAPGAVMEGACIAILGADSERSTALPLLERIPRKKRIDLIGRCDILTAAACLQECSLFLGNDSGLMHLAAAAYTPTLGLFGPSRDDLYAPWGDHCAVARTAASYKVLSSMPEFRLGRNESLMESLSVDVVEAAAVALWRSFHSDGATPATATTARH